MKLVCECDEILEFVKDEDSENVEDEGYYCTKQGGIDIHGEHDQVWFNCRKCGAAYWIFT